MGNKVLESTDFKRAFTVYKAVNDIVSIGGYFTACYIIEDRAAWRSIRESFEGFFVCLSPNPQDPI